MCRLYTVIHAKPKPKFKTGAISESTTALNVDQSNTSVLNAEQKSAAPSAALPLPSTLAPSSTACARANGTEQAVVAPKETGGTGGVGSVALTASTIPQRKEGALSKAQADKKKLDARKKSLKRL